MDAKEKNKPSERTDVMEIINADTQESAQNSDFREHSRNLLESTAGKAQEKVSERRGVKKTMDPELHSKTSEYREHSQ